MRHPGEPPMMIQTIEHCAKCGCDYAVATTLNEAAFKASPNPKAFADAEHAAVLRVFADDHAGHQAHRLAAE